MAEEIRTNGEVTVILKILRKRENKKEIMKRKTLSHLHLNTVLSPPTLLLGRI